MGGLTWKDLATTVLAAAVAGVYLAPIATQLNIPIISDARGAVLVLGALGLAMCIFGASQSASASASPFTIVASLLGAGALVLVIAGLVTGAKPIVMLLTADILVLWALTTVRHFSGVTSPA